MMIKYGWRSRGVAIVCLIERELFCFFLDEERQRTIR